MSKKGQVSAQFILDAAEVLGTEAGRRFVAGIIYSNAGLDVPSFCGGIKDGMDAAMHGAFYEGRRAVGSDVRNLLMHEHPHLWSQLEHERVELWLAEQERNRNTRTSAVTEKSDER